jgi:hypothetical protein
VLVTRLIIAVKVYDSGMEQGEMYVNTEILSLNISGTKMKRIFGTHVIYVHISVISCHWTTHISIILSVKEFNKAVNAYKDCILKHTSLHIHNAAATVNKKYHFLFCSHHTSSGNIPSYN